MLQFFDTLTDDSGNALLGATVQVATYPGGAPTGIYATNGTVSPIANSTVAADITGQISFYAPDGAYTLTYAYKGSTYKTRTPVQILDPMGFVAITDTGIANALVVSSPALSAQLYPGLKIEVKAFATNTGATQLIYQGGALQPVVQAGGSALAAGMIQANGLVRLEWDGGAWELIGSQSQPFYARNAVENTKGVVPTNTSVADYLACGMVLLERYGGVGDGTNPGGRNDTAFVNAMLVAGEVDAPIGITSGLNDSWLFSQGWVGTGSGQAAFGNGAAVGGAGSQGCRVVGLGFPYVKFALTPTSDMLTMGGSKMPQMVLRNLQLDANSTGRDGLVILGSNRPIIDNVTILNTVRDAIAPILVGNNFIEKLRVKTFSAVNIGRHVVYVQLSGGANYLAYFNQSTWEHVEVRKCAALTAGGTFFAASAAAGGDVNSVKVANHTFIAPALDCGYDGTGPVPGVSPFTTDSAVMQNFSIIGGGWESAKGVSPGAGYGCTVTGTGTWAGLFTAGVLTNSFWGSGVSGIPYNPAITALFDFNFSQARAWLAKLASLYNQPLVVEDFNLFENKNVFGGSSSLKKTHVKTSLPASQTDGIPYDGLLHATVAGATSATCHLQFPLALISPVPISDFVHTFVLTLSNSKFTNFNGNVTEVYLIQVAPDLSTCLATVIKSGSSAGQVASVTPTIVSTTTLDIAILTGANFATGGGNTTIYGNLHRGSFVQ